MRPEHVALEKRVERLEYWKTGDGTAHGAESRLSNLEETVGELDRLQLTEKFPEVRRLAFDVRDQVKAVVGEVAHVAEGTMSGDQIEAVIMKAVAKAIAGGKDARWKRMMPLLVGLVSAASSVAVALIARAAIMAPK
jgi:hypothetical protein